MRHKRLLLWLLCALFFFSLLACGISGSFSVTIEPPDRHPPGPPPGNPPEPPGDNPPRPPGDNPPEPPEGA